MTRRHLYAICRLIRLDCRAYRPAVRSVDDDDRHKPLNICGVIILTHRSVDQAIDQPPQLDQIGEPKRAPAGRDRHERIRLGRVGPAHRQRELPALLVKEEHPVLRPGLPNRHKHKLPPQPRMERMRHPNGSLITNRIKRS